MPTRFLVYLALFVACLYGAAVPHASAAPALKHVVLQLRWENQAQFAGYYAAKWQGYYEDAGFDVEIRPGVTPEGSFRSATDEVASGRADYGIGAADVLLAQDKGAPLIVLNSVFQRSAARFYALEKTPLRTSADLAMLRVAILSGDLTDMEMRAMLVQEGVDQKRVALYPLRLGIDQLLDGNVDVIAGYSIDQPYRFDAAGVKYKELNPVDYGVDFYGDSLFTRRDIVDADPAEVTRFSAASMKGWDWAIDHQVEVADRIAKEWPHAMPAPGGDSTSYNRFQIAKVVELTLHPVVEVGSTNPARWQRMHDQMQRAGILRNSLDVGSMVFNPAEIAMKERKLQSARLQWALIGLLGIASLGMLWVYALRGAVRARTAELRAVNVLLDRDVVALRQAQEHNAELLTTIEGKNAVLKETIDGSIKAMGRVVESRDPYTSGHEERVAEIAVSLAREMGLTDTVVESVRVAGLVHDVGKMRVPAEILSKPGRLTKVEFDLVKDHSPAGYEILRSIRFEWPIADMVRQHHERMDGSGYPDGLSGDDILIEARILAVADVVEAMASHRPYRPSLGLDAAVSEIREHPDKFDPAVIAACVSLFERGEIPTE